MNTESGEDAVSQSRPSRLYTTSSTTDMESNGAQFTSSNYNSESCGTSEPPLFGDILLAKLDITSTGYSATSAVSRCRDSAVEQCVLEELFTSATPSSTSPFPKIVVSSNRMQIPPSKWPSCEEEEGNRWMHCPNLQKAMCDAACTVGMTNTCTPVLGDGEVDRHSFGVASNNTVMPISCSSADVVEAEPCISASGVEDCCTDSEGGQQSYADLSPLSSNTSSSYSSHTTSSSANETTEWLEPPYSHRGSSPSNCRLGVSAFIFWHLVTYCDYPSICQLLCVSVEFWRLVTHDVVWHRILVDLNLLPLLQAHHCRRQLYSFFVGETVTTRALYGRYTFEANNKSLGEHLDSSTDDPFSTSNVCKFEEIVVLISAASMGQVNHMIGRVQMMCVCRDGSLEMLLGMCRFSLHRRCFVLCCTKFDSATRGPIFTVAVERVNRIWANECRDHFAQSKGGLRLVLRPTLLEGPVAGSLITENDVFAVSKPLS